MITYNHILFLTEGDPKKKSINKADALAKTFGARLSIGNYLPNTLKLSHGILDIKKESRKNLETRLYQIGKRYKIPREDQWVLSLDEKEPYQYLHKNQVDLIIFDKKTLSISSIQLANKILQCYFCSVYFIN